MAKKRGKTKSSRSVKTKSRAKGTVVNKNKINLVIKNLIVFLMLALASFLFYQILGNDIMKSFFSLLSIIFACVSGAFVVILIAFIIFKATKN